MLIVILLLLFTAQLASAQDTFTGVERIVALGDVHGDYPAFTEILQSAGVIDAKSRWTGGKTHLVLTGDMLDRGPASRKVMELLMALEKPAAKAGGRVHALIGNHEAMNMYGDLRYVSPGEFAAFKTGESDRVRDALWEQELAQNPNQLTKADRKKWDEEHPLGWVEHRLQFGPEGTYGKWLRTKNAIVKINDSMFLHGGISTKFEELSIEQFNNTIRAELKDVSKINQNTSVLVHPDGLLWYRGLAQDSGPEIQQLTLRLLEKHGVTRIVIGHTPTPGAVLPRLGGRVISIDVGMSAYYGSSRACLIIEGEKLYAMHRGQKIELPNNDAEFTAYLKKVAALEKPSSQLSKFVAQVLAQSPGVR